GMNLDDLALSVFHEASALDDITVFQPHHIARKQPEVLLGRFFHEVVAFDPEFARKREFALPGVGIVRVTWRVAGLTLTLGVIGDDQLQWVKNSDAAGRNRVKVVAQRLLKNTVIDLLMSFGNPQSVAEQAYG